MNLSARPVAPIVPLRSLGAARRGNGCGRIFFVNRFYLPDRSATSQLLTDVASHLARAGRDVTVVTSRRRYDDATARLAPRETVDGVAILRLPMARFRRSRLVGRALEYLAFHGFAFAALLRRVRPGDIVVAKTDPPLIGVTAGVACALRGAALVNWIQDLFPEVASAAGLGGLAMTTPALRRLRNWSLRRAAFNVVLGRRMADRVEREGVRANRIGIIPNWVEDRQIRPRDRDGHPLRARWGLGGQFVVGYSGNMGRVHDFATIRALVLALKEDPEIRFLFVGDGLHRAWLERETAAAGPGRVMFQPYQRREDLAQSLTAIDLHLITLLPSFEGLVVPSKFYGVIAAGRPTLFVGDPAGEIGGLLEAGGCGLAVRPGEVDRAAAFVRGLARDPARAVEMGRNARILCEAKFRSAEALARWEGLLANVSA